MKPKFNIPSFLKSSSTFGTALALGMFLGTAHAAPVAVVWDIDNVATPGATTPTGVIASTLATVSPVSWTSDSSNGGWRTRGYSGTDDYVQFSLTTDATTTLTLESLIFGARCRAANTSGGAWTAPEITLEYATDAAFTTPIAAGTLDLGPDLAEGAEFGAGTLFTSDAGTFFSTDLTINPSETYYFRLRASDATGATTSRNQLYYDNVTDMTLNGDLTSSSTALVWTGSTDNNWNTSTTNWEESTAPGVPVVFVTNDEVIIDVPATIAIDGGGIVAGDATVNTGAGNVSLSGGTLTTGLLSVSGTNTLSISNSLNTGVALTDLSSAKLQIEAGGTLTTSGINLSGGASTELIVNDATASLVNSGATNLGTTGGRIRVATGASLTLGTVTTTASTASLDKRSDGSLTITGPVASDANPVDLDIIGGTVNFDGNVEVHIGNSGTNSTNGPITLDETQFVLHGVNFQGSGGGSIESLNSTSRIKSDFNAGNNTINVPVILTSDLTIEARAGDNSQQTYSEVVSGAGNLSKVGPGTVFFTADNTYTGTTSVAEGALIIDGDSSAATGAISVALDAVLGGNGTSGAAVTLATGAGLAAAISDWTGAAGTGYDDLAVASLDAGSFPINVEIDTTGLVNFTESAASFTILNTSGGITNFVPGTVTITAPGFAGTGTWALAESPSGSLTLSYTPVGGDYSTWAADNGIGGEPASGD